MRTSILPHIGVVALALTGTTAHPQSFVSKSSDVGMGAAHNMNASAVADYDLDGDLDIYMVNFSQHDAADSYSWNRLYRNNGDGTFSDVTTAAGVEAKSVQGYEVRSMGIRFGAAWGDYDDDGDPDLLLTHVGPEILYRNNGDGTFTDVTQGAGVAGEPEDDSESSSAVWLDFDNDGDLDLYVSAWNYGPNRLYENDGTGVFTDIAAEAGVREVGSTWTTLPIDVNADGLTDLYTVNDFGQNKVFINNGDRTFTDETKARGLGDVGHGMGATIGDFNNDGHFDIYLTNIYTEGIEWNPLYMDDGTGHFENVSQALGVDNADWAWGTAFFDCDHDGDLDLFVGNGYFTTPDYNDRMFVNQLVETGSATFVDQAETAGVAGTADARGVVPFDYDDDGDQDILVSNPPVPWVQPGEGVAPYLYENVSSSLNWLKIKLRGTISNRNGVGATVRVEADGRSYYRQNDGVGFLSQSLQPLHVGIGASDVVDEIEVKWPSGLGESYHDIAANQTVELEEGQGVSTAAERNPDPTAATASGLQIEGAFPNPFAGVVTLKLAGGTTGSFEIHVTNLLGQVVATRRFDLAANQAGKMVRVDLSSLPPGMYFYTVPGQNYRPIVKGR